MADNPIAYDAYQKLAEAYAENIDTKPHNAYYDRPAMLGLLPDVRGKRVLDAGCGPGVYAEAIHQRGATVVGCDMCDRMLELASERVGAIVELKKVDLTKPLSMFDDEDFDVVNAPLCLDYIEDWTTLFKEFRRVLVPGGVLLFSCGHPSFDAEYFKTNQYFSVEQVRATWKGFGIEVDMPSYRRSFEEVIMPVINAGFTVERVHEPLPTDAFKAADLMRYMKLMHRPGFLCVVASK